MLHLLVDGMLLAHEGLTRDEVVEMMIRYLGANLGDANEEVNDSRGAHARFSYLKRIFKERLLQQLEGDMEEEVQKLQAQAIRI